MLRRVTATAVTFIAATSIAIGTTTWSGSASAAGSHGHPAVKLIKVSHDSYKNDGAQHATEAEPDTLAFGNTVVSVFQVGRFESGGGAIDNGWGTSTDKGKTWTHGVLPGITIAEGGKWPRVSDPTIAYDAKFGTWLAAGIVIDSTNTGRGVSVNSSKDGVHWKKPVMAEGKFSGFYDKDWIVCDNHKQSKFYGNCYADRSGRYRRRVPGPTRHPGSAVSHWCNPTARSWCPTRQTRAHSARSAPPTAASRGPRPCSSPASATTGRSACVRNRCPAPR